MAHVINSNIGKKTPNTFTAGELSSVFAQGMLELKTTKIAEDYRGVTSGWGGTRENRETLVCINRS